MKTVLFESEVFALDKVKGISPFQIILQKTSENGIEKVEVIRKDFVTVYEIGDSIFGTSPRTEEEFNTISTVMWREIPLEIANDYSISAIIKKYIDKKDYMNVFDFDGPSNEYDIEINSIRQLITKESTVGEIASAIRNTFLYYFEEKLDVKDVYETSLRIKTEIDETLN